MTPKRGNVDGSVAMTTTADGEEEENHSSSTTTWIVLPVFATVLGISWLMGYTIFRRNG